MTPKERLQDSLLRYPSTNYNKIAVYMQWFLSTTPEWKGGELYERGYYYKVPMTMEEAYIKVLEDTIEKVKTDEFYQSDLLFLSNRLVMDKMNHILNWESVAGGTLELSSDQNVRWISDSCALLCIPKNITKEWSEVVDEMKEWLGGNRSKFERGDRKLIDRILGK